MTAVLTFVSVRFGYLRGAPPVLEDLSFQIHPGEGAALLGPNGVGKTTVARLAMAIRSPQHGAVTTVGRPTRALGPEDLADAVGYVFQHPEMQMIERTVAAELGFGPRRMGWPQERIDKRVGAVLRELGLAAVASTHPYDLPVGHRRLVALGAALMVEPSLLILDEPTAGLDREARKTVHRVVRGQREEGTAVLAVTHDTEFAVEALERGLVLDSGSLVADGPLADLLARHRATGLSLPGPALIAHRLGWPTRSLRTEDVTVALVERCRQEGPSIS